MPFVPAVTDSSVTVSSSVISVGKVIIGLIINFKLANSGRGDANFHSRLRQR